MKVALFCKCGAAWEGEGVPPVKAAVIEKAFRDAHREPGCGPATRKEAAKARRRAERLAELQAERGARG